MDNQITVKELLESYDEITIKKEITKEIFIIKLYEKEFLFVAPLHEDPTSSTAVFLYNDSGVSIPHIMLQDESCLNIKNLPQGKYRWVCLYENESVVNSIIPYEDKVIDAINRLLELLSMNNFEKEREFQKEFMFYWNNQSVGYNKFDIYLSQEQRFSKMCVYYNQYNVRLIERSLYLKDIDQRKNTKRIWVEHLESDAYYIPISDCRGILPPHRGHFWTVQDVRNIVYAKQIEHISDETYSALKNTYSNTRTNILVFGMHSNVMNIVFAVKLICKHAKKDSLMNKIQNDCIAVEPLETHRKDYLYLCKQIGNDIGIMKKKVLIVGAGSLGSYVISEIVKNGATNVRIYDGDILEDENICRWAYGGLGMGSNKAKTIEFLLNLLHPEINVEGIPSNIDEKTILEEAQQSDLIIFTVGSSDIQLKFNKILKNNACTTPTIFVWLEAGGQYSHILIVNYSKKGCFECLYTNEKGDLINNRAQLNLVEDEKNYLIRNGCGGTRAAYGTSIILRTTAVLLNVIKKIQENEFAENILLDISPNDVKVSDTPFPMEACGCCGNKKLE